MILTPVDYFIARLVNTARQSRGGVWLLLAFIVVVAVCVVGVSQLPEWAPALLLTPDE